VSSNRGQVAPQPSREKSRIELLPGRSVSVQEGYERWAPTYDRDLNPLLALEERKLKPLVSHPRGKRVLDLACGTGRWLAWLLAQGAASGVGVDLSAAMLAVARRKPALQKRLVQADCGAIPFADGVFDLVTCSFALGHIPDSERLAREVGRVTVAGADVYVSDLHPLVYAQGWRTAFRDRRGAVQIVTWPRSVEESLAPWIAAGFECKHLADFRLGKPERPILARAGKDWLFNEVRHTPALLLCHFRQTARPQVFR
jgi:ubiquinone/menaquinone biosynthesis C-methylase UbiE